MNSAVINENSQNGILPEDFLQFLSKNYKTINDIEQKIAQFQNDPWNNFYKKMGCRNWRNMRLCSTKRESVDSCFSDKDIKKVIRAKLKPKMKRLPSNEQIHVDEGDLPELTTGKKDATIDYTYLVQNFPLTYFAPDLYPAHHHHRTEGEMTEEKKQQVCSVSSTSVASHFAPADSDSQVDITCKLIKFMVEGNRFPLTERTSSSVSRSPKKESKGCYSTKQLLRGKKDYFQDGGEHSSDESSYSVSLWNSDNPRHEPKKRDHSYESDPPSSSRQLLTLTLPPLHQSVLTLLGQKSGVKSSPRNHVIHELGSAFDSTSGAQKAKKLRRHGRKKKSKEDGKESEEKEIEKPEKSYRAGDRGDNDELQETQLNELQNDNDLEEDDDAQGIVAKSPTYVKEIKSLRDVLDEHLCKETWSQKEMERLNVEIEKLSVGLKKYQTSFKTKSITINEDTLLAFPRTSTHTSATFGVPSSSKVLRELTPIYYLRNFVMVSEPRLHLYNLIYQRYRMLENPMGKFITIKSLQRALTEVLGRPFSDEEIQQLQNSYLNLETSYELDSRAFAGICAFCERIYGKYELEKCNECIVCSKNSGADKERCHMKRKSALEDMDLSHLYHKVRSGETTKSMSDMIHALTQSETRP